MNYGRFLSNIAKERQQSPLRIFSKYLLNPAPTLINMSAGYPNPNTFPFKDVKIGLNDGSSIDIDNVKMKTALQYSNTQGLPDFLSWLKNLQTAVHNPPTLQVPNTQDSHMEMLVTPGSQDGVVKAFECLLNPGDSVLLEEPTYPGSLAFMKPQGYNLIKVQGDGQGLIPESLRETLSRWSPEQCRSTTNNEIPRLLYLIPTAGNPTGTTISDDRRREIYKIAQEYDLMIIEDDPYYYLNFGNELPLSFLSLDIDGRVIRTDSFSKILSSGMRIGFISGPSAIMQKILMHMQATICHTSGISQMMMLEILTQWGIEGFMKHVKHVQRFYQDRRDVTVKYADKHLTGLTEWNVPTGGMFLWMTVPGLKDTKRLVTERLVNKELIVAPGNVFMSNRDEPCQNLRVSFSFATEDQINDGFQRLAEAIKSELAE